ncbi:MAG: hypothetical protein IPL01_06140 [Acidobacteria bacterium]|nr:hypothetical protein [Acidobacteriota bacterium]
MRSAARRQNAPGFRIVPPFQAFFLFVLIIFRPQAHQHQIEGGQPRDALFGVTVAAHRKPDDAIEHICIGLIGVRVLGVKRNTQILFSTPPGCRVNQQHASW